MTRNLLSWAAELLAIALWFIAIYAAVTVLFAVTGGLTP